MWLNPVQPMGSTSPTNFVRSGCAPARTQKTKSLTNSHDCQPNRNGDEQSGNIPAKGIGEHSDGCHRQKPCG